jgi:hypothetical protein
MDNDTVRLLIIVACAVVSSTIRMRHAGIALIACVLFVAFDVALNAPAFREPSLPEGQAVASVIFVSLLPTAAAFAAPRMGPWIARPLVSALVAGLCYVLTLLIALALAVNTGLLIP